MEEEARGQGGTLTVAAPTETHSFFVSSKVREEELHREATVRRGIRPEGGREGGKEGEHE